MENFNYRKSAIEKISKTKITLNDMLTRNPENKTLIALKDQTTARMAFEFKALEGWYREGIKEDWDSETISNGKAACMGAIDALELLVKDINRTGGVQLSGSRN